MVSEIQFKNFKIFKEQQSLKLRPITVLLGKNNSGKSAVAKITLMIGDLLKNQQISHQIKVGSDSRNSVELGSGFKDLVYNRNEAGILNINLMSENYSFYFWYNQRYGFIEAIVNDMDFIRDEREASFLLPIGEPVILDLKYNFDYIGAIRVLPDSDYSNSADKFDKIGVNGENAYQILIQDFNNEKKLFNKVNEWYKSKFEGWGVNILKIDKSEIKYEVVLESGNLSINLKQTGQGIHQVLPLIVRSYMLETEPTLIVVEEPETHLHPAAHGDLAQRFVDSILEDKNKRYLIETHSENFVLRLRKLVAQREIKPNDLAIYYVEYNDESKSSNLRQIKIDEFGNIPNDDWPSGIFSEASVEVRGIINAQMKYSVLND